jgi:hypothetical protein
MWCNKNDPSYRLPGEMDHSFFPPVSQEPIGKKIEMTAPVEQHPPFYPLVLAAERDFNSGRCQY